MFSLKCSLKTWPESVLVEPQCEIMTAPIECPLSGSANNAKILRCAFPAAAVRFCLMVSGARTQLPTHSHTPIQQHTHSRTNAQRRESLFSATTARTSVLVSGPHSFLYLYPYECICVSVHLPRFLFQLLAFCCGCCWPSCR